MYNERIKQDVVKNENGRYFFVSTIERLEWVFGKQPPRYETEVFKCRKDGTVKEWKELEWIGAWTLEEAKVNHEKMVKNYGERVMEVK